jgi:hypothetical protein
MELSSSFDPEQSNIILCSANVEIGGIDIELLVASKTDATAAEAAEAMEGERPAALEICVCIVVGS